MVLVAFLVGPLAGFEPALDVNLRALLQVLLGNPDQPVRVDRDAVPFRALLPLAAGLVLPALARGDRQVCDAPAALKRADFKILAEIPDQRRLVQATGHDQLLSSAV